MVRTGGLDSPHAEQLAVEWLLWLRDVRDRSQNTLEQYNKVLRYWLRWCASNDVEPLRPSVEELEAYMTRKREATGRKGTAATQRADAAALRGWFRWLHERGKLPNNPALDLHAPSTERLSGRPIEDEHWQVIWQAPLTQRMRAILGMGFYCGLRREEIGSLRSDQITPTRIVRFTRKGGSTDTIPWRDMAQVHAERLPHLLPDPHVFTSAVEYVRNNHHRLIPWELPKELYRQLQKLCSKLDIPAYTPHQLRHSTATNLLRAGLPPHIVMRLMNHSSFDITMGYVRAGANELREWMDHS